MSDLPYHRISLVGEVNGRLIEGIGSVEGVVGSRLSALLSRDGGEKTGCWENVGKYRHGGELIRF